MKLKECSVVITGGASGFGKNFAEYLSPQVRKVIIIDKNAEASELFTDFDNIDYYVCDITEAEMVSDVIDDIYSDTPETSILINNAGIIYSELMYNLFNKDDRRHSVENWDRYLKANLSSVFYISRSFIGKLLNDRKKGLIINISSISANGNAGQSVYSAAKAGVNALTIAWSRELSVHGIRAVGIAPGFFSTPSTHQSLKETTIKKITKEIPLRRLGEVEELSQTVKYIIENDYINGTILELDGGLTIS